MDSYVARYQRDSEEWQAAAAAGFVAAFLVGASAWAVAAGIAALVGSELVEPVRVAVVLSAGVPAWIAVAAWFLRHRRLESDPQGVVFSLDEDGVYLGGKVPEQQIYLPWKEIVELQQVDVPSGDASIRYLVVVREPSDRLVRDPLGRGPHREWKQGYRRGELDRVRAVAAQYAPDVVVRGDSSR